VSNSVSANYYFYNKLGYAQCHRQKTGSSAYDFRYTTRPQGDWKQMEYPSKRVVSYSFNDRGLAVAAGGFASGVEYEAQGAVRKLTFGNTLVETTAYNSRLQPTAMQLGTAGTPNSTWQLENVYSGTANNGNVIEQRLMLAGVTGWSSPVSTVYRYDAVNRLALASEKPVNGAIRCVRRRRATGASSSITRLQHYPHTFQARIATPTA
jgi:hypothetical protein